MEITNLVCCSDSRCSIDIQVNQYCPGCICLTQYTKCFDRINLFYIFQFNVPWVIQVNHIHYNDYAYYENQAKHRIFWTTNLFRMIFILALVFYAWTHFRSILLPCVASIQIRPFKYATHIPLQIDIRLKYNTYPVPITHFVQHCRNIS